MRVSIPIRKVAFTTFSLRPSPNSDNEDIRTNIYRDRRAHPNFNEIDSRSSGLGLATTKLLSEKGVNVAVLDLHETPLNTPRIKFWKCDVSDDARVEECINEAVEWSVQESKPLAGAVCCAGIGMAGRVFPSFRVDGDYLPRRHAIFHGCFPKSL